ncbi:hypothetical protein [Pectobacterium carotovorum]|uniref:hypothetical protein n=1 Tax=Pectobacterium carotovorum TaxID=554 RepID=UPI0005044E86|nr:hypothetical protein [Pectobacterium carotovorum]KFW97734.1 hypothetical protein JV33_20515 [Pectobacterium carotovorum subsp. carotovorum]KML64992.1 hypothetical protein G032_21300 [Pectobacterium carotovorum subsp. carotovorum ICMP 5702]SHH69755.1 hypothetical protein SAMN05444147_11681 [Pectobacterium carotovorum]
MSLIFKCFLYACISIFFSLLIALCILSIHKNTDKERNKSLIANKSYWASCKLVEVNIRIDWHSAAQNKLICGDVIENVSKAEYEFVMEHASKNKIKSTKDD